MQNNMKILQNLTHENIKTKLMSSREVFLVKMSVSQTKKIDKELKEKEQDYGKNMRELWGRLDLNTLSLKTAQCCLFQDLNKSYATFSNSGMMLNGDVFMLPTSDFHTIAKGSMVLPTPIASDGLIILNKVQSYKKFYQRKKQDRLIYQCQLNGLTANQTMKLYEWMMGFPKNWIRNLYTPT